MAEKPQRGPRVEEAAGQPGEERRPFPGARGHGGRRPGDGRAAALPPAQRLPQHARRVIGRELEHVEAGAGEEAPHLAPREGVLVELAPGRPQLTLTPGEVGPEQPADAVHVGHGEDEPASRLEHAAGLREQTLGPRGIVLHHAEGEVGRGRPVPHGEGAVMANVIVFANQKGGVAKTTTTLNLGVAIRETGKRVLVIDLDPQGNLTMSQGMNPDAIERSMFDVLVHRVPISDVIHTVEVDIAVASIDLAGAELSLSALIGRERALEKALVEVRDRYDYILIDTPPSLGLLTINAFVAADGVIVPVQCEYLSLRGLVQLENTLSMVRENLNPRVHVQGIVPTMFDGRTLHAREAIEILEEHFGDLVYNTRIRKTVRYAEAPVKGSSVLRYDPTGPAAQAYRDLAKEVLDGAQARDDA